MTIYDVAKIKCRTFIESINTLFSMGSELEQEVDTIETSVGTSDDEASFSGSLWARIKYALANMVATSGAQTIADVKTFTSSPTVPTTPASIESAVNQAYVESTVDGVNNLVHKSGDESIAGKKTFAKPPVIALHEAGTNNTDGWRKLLISPSFATPNENNTALFDIIDNNGYYARFKLIGRNNVLTSLILVDGSYSSGRIKVSRDSTGEIIIWGYNYRSITIMIYEIHTGRAMTTFVDSGTTLIFEEPTTDTYEQVVTYTS